MLDMGGGGVCLCASSLAEAMKLLCTLQQFITGGMFARRAPGALPFY